MKTQEIMFTYQMAETQNGVKDSDIQGVEFYGNRMRFLYRHQTSVQNLDFTSIKSLSPRIKDGTVDGSFEIRQENHLECIKPVVNNGINYQPQLVLARFLNHQQYLSPSLIDRPLCETKDHGSCCCRGTSILVNCYMGSNLLTHLGPKVLGFHEGMK